MIYGAPIEHPVKLVDGVFVKGTTFPVEGTVCPQHSHSHDHLSWIATGGARIEAGGVVIGDFYAPCGVTIRAGAVHLFTTLRPDTTVLCIHNADRWDHREDEEIAHAV